MPYTIIYDRKAQRDAMKLPPSQIAFIRKQVEERLTIAPFDYCEPLQYQFKGSWRLRVGDWRVVYKVVGQVVLVERIAHRKDVYEG
jgi:mRNA interferase RelE/StbE